MNAKPIRPSFNASSDQNPAIPKWLLLWHTTRPMPEAFALRMQSCMANSETTAPKPFSPSTLAVLTVSEERRGIASGLISPALKQHMEK